MDIKKYIDYGVIELELNEILNASCGELLSNKEKVMYYSGLFDRTGESGFYKSVNGPRAVGEQPTWKPNPAYMDSLEEIWEPVDIALKDHGLRIDNTLRENFQFSREYKDKDKIHRRVFNGQIIDCNRGKNGLPSTFYMLTVPHSHLGFEYVNSPMIQLSRSLL